MSLHHCFSKYVFMGTLALASMALGQSKPFGDEDPYLRSARGASASNYSSGYGNYENGYPASDVRIAVDANARATWARQQYYRAQDALNSAVHALSLQFEQSPELKDAQNAEKQAYDSLLLARTNALKNVVIDPRYQAETQLRKEMAEQISQLQQQKGITATDLLPYALAKLSYATTITTMEASVLATDSQVRDAREKLMAAGARVSDLRSHFDMAIRTNPDLLALRHRIDDARISFITAEAFRDGAIDAACVALRYAYNHDQLSTVNPGNGLGYGYSYPIGFRY